MSRIGSIHIAWKADGKISWKLDFPDKDPEQLYSMGAVALTDHLLATLLSNAAVGFCEAVLEGLVNGKIEVRPIGPELKSAALELYRGRVLYTIFSPKSKLFADNHKLEQAISQMAQNYIGKVLATATKANSDAIKFGILGVVTNYEQQIRAMHSGSVSSTDARMNIAKAVGVFINRYPYGIRSEDLEKHLGDVGSLIEKWKTLPLKEKQPLFRS